LVDEAMSARTSPIKPKTNPMIDHATGGIPQGFLPERFFEAVVRA